MESGKNKKLLIIGGVVVGLAVVGAAIGGNGESSGEDGGVESKESVVPEKVMITDMKAKGTNGITVEFGLVKGVRYVLSEGELKAEFRGWTGTGVGDVMATLAYQVKKEDFTENNFGTIKFVKDFTLDVKRPFPPLTNHLQGEFTFTPAEGGKPISWSDRVSHSMIRVNQ